MKKKVLAFLAKKLKVCSKERLDPRSKRRSGSVGKNATCGPKRTRSLRRETKTSRKNAKTLARQPYGKFTESSRKDGVELALCVAVLFFFPAARANGVSRAVRFLGVVKSSQRYRCELLRVHRFSEPFALERAKKTRPAGTSKYERGQSWSGRKKIKPVTFGTGSKLFCLLMGLAAGSLGLRP